MCNTILRWEQQLILYISYQITNWLWKEKLNSPRRKLIASWFKYKALTLIIINNNNQTRFTEIQTLLAILCHSAIYVAAIERWMKMSSVLSHMGAGEMNQGWNAHAALQGTADCFLAPTKGDPQISLTPTPWALMSTSALNENPHSIADSSLI